MYGDIFSRFDKANNCDKQIDGQTDRITLACTTFTCNASHGNHKQESQISADIAEKPRDCSHHLILIICENHNVISVCDSEDKVVYMKPGIQSHQQSSQVQLSSRDIVKAY